ncbi:MAG: c-type cytochrome [Planctomycetes bacterium]|nr:c-type cytochrome [Planctomycetota bacterium]
MRNSLAGRLLILAVICGLPGCTGKTPAPVGKPNTDAADKGTVTQTTDTTKAAEGSPTPAEPDPALVRLGDSSLTAGIPGDGPLTESVIAAWLDEPRNHLELSVELPLGLASAAAQIVIPKDNPLTRAKIELGRQLYFDTRLSSDNSVSCSSCHHPDEGYGRHTQFGIGVGGQKGGRNSPVSYNRILSAAQFWDGRADSLETQAKGPIANPIEMGNTHEKAVATLQSIPGYVTQFQRIFTDGVTIDNVGRAIAAFERVLVSGPSAYDYDEPFQRFVAANQEELEDLDRLQREDPELFARYQVLKKDTDDHPYSESARRGKELFFSERVGCTACHAGANFTDERYHNLGVGMDKDPPDLGRFDQTSKEEDRGAFKTPTVRNVTLSAPYMHDGSQATLEEVVDWYDKGGHPNPQLSNKIKKLNLNPQEKLDLVEFMKALTGPFSTVRTDRLP